MRRSFHTPNGIIERELTDTDIALFASKGDAECIRFLAIKDARAKLAAASTIAEKLQILKEFLGL